MRSTQILFFLNTLYGACMGNFCPSQPAGMVDLDYKRFHGSWYLIESGPYANNDTGPIDCMYEVLTPSSHPMWSDFVLHGRSEEGEIITEVGSLGLHDQSMKSSMTVYFGDTIFHSTVMATDYENWVIDYNCYGSSSLPEKFSLRSRTATLGNDVRTTLRQILHSYGANIDEFIETSHENCN